MINRKRKAGKENDKHKRGHANSKITVERHSERQAAGNRTEAGKRNQIQMGEAQELIMMLEGTGRKREEGQGSSEGTFYLEKGRGD